MRRTIFIEETLLEDAQRLLGTEGIRQTVEKALREVIRRHHLDQLRESLGKMQMGQTPEELTSLRNSE